MNKHEWMNEIFMHPTELFVGPVPAVCTINMSPHLTPLVKVLVSDLYQSSVSLEY